MADDRGCDLCGLPVEKDDFAIHTPESTLHFCCEGCEGIYRMMNDVEELPGPAEGRADAAE